MTTTYSWARGHSCSPRSPPSPSLRAADRFTDQAAGGAALYALRRQPHPRALFYIERCSVVVAVAVAAAVVVVVAVAVAAAVVVAVVVVVVVAAAVVVVVGGGGGGVVVVVVLFGT